MADIFSEVEEELRRDKYNALLRRYGLIAMGLAALLILGVALHQMVYVPWRNSQVYEASDAYAAAVALRTAGDAAGAETALAAIAAGDHDGYAALAMIQQAQMAEEAGDVSRAASLYAAAAEKADDESFAGLAQIKALYAMADEAGYDEILARAQPLVEAGSPYQYSARELIAGAALRAGDFQRASREYQYLTLAPETPSGMRARATEGLAAVDRAAGPITFDAAAEPDAETTQSDGTQPAADAPDGAPATEESPS